MKKEKSKMAVGVHLLNIWYWNLPNRMG